MIKSAFKNKSSFIHSFLSWLWTFQFVNWVAFFTASKRLVFEPRETTTEIWNSLDEEASHIFIIRELLRALSLSAVYGFLNKHENANAISKMI